MSSEEIFSRFASRVLFLSCDLSAHHSMLASGVLVSADGFVVTNAHRLKYYDKKRDTAVLKIEGTGFESFRPVTRTVRRGERIYAIGNPEGYRAG